MSGDAGLFLFGTSNPKNAGFVEKIIGIEGIAIAKRGI